MPIEMDVKLTGMKKVKASMKKIFGLLNNPRSMFDDEVKTLESIFRNRFASSDGGKWQPISSATEKIAGPHKPLMDKGGLAGSLGGRNKFSIRQIDGKRLRFGTNHPGADINNTGGVISITQGMRKFFAANKIYLRDDTSSIRIPKRLFFFVNTKDESRIFSTWRSWANSILRRNTTR